jgi:hypothetical protein
MPKLACKRPVECRKKVPRTNQWPDNTLQCFFAYALHHLGPARNKICPCSYFHSPSLAATFAGHHAQFLSAAIGSHRSILMEALTSSSILESPHAANQLSISSNRIRRGAACTHAFIRPHISLSRSISRSSLLSFLLLCIVSFPFSSSCSFTFSFFLGGSR